ncbi:hypothetical protein [Vibrio metschnikovii]|uniref:hypothetical protein n=1 Tax=Vibrio metschnikovii TaxID=28172 RepID=UPI001C2F9F1A|nr:hypothetical protein [Vibrio metschnikovii]
MSEAVQTQTKARKPRFHGHEPFNDILRADWINAIKQSPDNFDALLYRPIGEVAGDSDDDYQKETVIELDTNQDNLTYGDPELVAVLDCPDEQENFFMMDDGENNLGEAITPLMLRIGATDIPIGSVLEWDEEISNGVRTVWWYVHKSVGYGAANVGVIYICIPMRDFNQEPPAEPVEQEESTSELNSGFIEL